MKTDNYGYTKTKKGILTVGQLVKLLEGLDGNTQIVIGDEDGWYYNIDVLHLPSEDGYTALTFNQGDPCNSRQF